MKTFFIFILVFSSTFTEIIAQTIYDKIEIYNSVLHNYDTVLSKYHEKVLLVDSTCLTQIKFNSFTHDTITSRKLFDISLSDVDKTVKLINSIIDSSKKRELIPGEIVLSKNYRRFHFDSLKLLQAKYIDTLKVDPTEKFWAFIYNTLKYSGYCMLSKPYFYNHTTAIVYFFWMTSSLSGAGWNYVYSKINGKWVLVAQWWQWIS